MALVLGIDESTVVSIGSALVRVRVTNYGRRIRMEIVAPKETRILRHHLERDLHLEELKPKRNA